jgi:hypothetical protein
VVLELETGLPASHGAVAAMDEDVGEGLQKLRLIKQRERKHTSITGITKYPLTKLF